MNRKIKIMDLFFNKGMNCEEIARKLQVTVQAVNKLLHSTNEYKEYCMKKRMEAESIRNVILDLFFGEGLKMKDIAVKSNVSAAYVSKVIKQDYRYEKEKLRRKTANSDRHERDKRIFNRRKRMEKKKEDNAILSNLVALQNQNARAMSMKRKINGDQMIKINLQHYRYNSLKKRLEYDDTAGLLPKGISKVKYDTKY